jgi:hypothetical protein
MTLLDPLLGTQVATDQVEHALIAPTDPLAGVVKQFEHDGLQDWLQMASVRVYRSMLLDLHQAQEVNSAARLFTMLFGRLTMRLVADPLPET